MRRLLDYFSGSSLFHVRTQRIFMYGALFSTLVLISTGCEQRPLPEAESPAAMLYAAKCSICHPLRHPKVHTYTGWKKTIPIMEKRAEELGITPFLSKEEKKIILGYMKKHARIGF